jgi:3'-phosphoadenosine 5'-phosphosulfate sulfotransferase (PAPS reductase)/FAD synthetase
MRDDVIIAALSGGRDSTAMVLKRLERGERIDYIYFSDTLHEFDLMYEYLEKVAEYITKTYGKQVIRLKPRSTFEDWVFGEMTRGEHKGAIRGLPKITDPCFWKRESKTTPADAFVKSLGVPYIKLTKLVGYTASEKDRVQKDPDLEYPLIDWGWCEGDVSAYLESIDMVNPLYEYFSRTGCDFCPYMSLRSYYIVWKFFKKTWAYMKNIEDPLQGLEKLGYKVVNSRWQRNHTLAELEARFESGNDGYSDTPDRDCFCAV